MNRSLYVPESPAAPPLHTHGWTRLIHLLQTVRRHRLLRDLQRRADWAGQARQAPTVRDWMDDIDGIAPELRRRQQG